MKTRDAVSLNAVSNLIPPAVGILSAPILARALGPADRGDVAGVSVNLVIAASAFTLGLPEALTYFVGRDGAVQRDRLWRVLFILGAVGAAAGALLTLTADMVGYSTSSRPALLIVAWALPAVLILSAIRGVAAGMQAWRRIAVERLLTSGVRLLAFAGLWMTGLLTVTSAVAVITCSTLLGLICYNSIFRIALRQTAPTDLRQGLGSFAVRYWPGALAGALLVRVDQFLMVPLSTSEQLGLFVTAVTLFEACSFASNAVRDVIFSVESQGRDVQRVTAASRLAGLVTLVMASVVALAAVPVVPLLFGTDFAGAVPVLLILLPAAVFGASSSVAAAALSGWGQAGWRSAGLVLSLAVKVAALVVLVPSLGAVGAACATLVGSATIWAVVAIAMWRTVSVSPVALLVPTGRDVNRLRSLVRRPSR